MKYLKILLFLLIFSNLSASYLLDKNSPLCIEDFYYKNSRIYFQKSSNLNWDSTREDHTATHIFQGYIYDSDNNICKPDVHLLLGMDVKDFNFLLGLIGLIVGGVFLFFTVDAFVKVGGKK